ncbi:hypothetical protein MBLNU13_g01868t2 [Cladosporium sp. NU13]
MLQLYTFDHWEKQPAPKIGENRHSLFKGGCGTAARLMAFYIRRQRGLLSFKCLPLQELRHFATLRGIQVGPDATATIVKAQLEKADNEATFDRITELPPEIRQSTPTHLLARIKSLKLYFRNLNVSLAIDLRTGNDPIDKINISRMGYYSWNSSVSAQARRQQLLSALRALATGIAARPGPLDLRLSDIEEAGEMMRSIIDVAATESSDSLAVSNGSFCLAYLEATESTGRRGMFQEDCA